MYPDTTEELATPVSVGDIITEASGNQHSCGREARSLPPSLSPFDSCQDVRGG